MAGEESFFTQGRLEMSAVPLPGPQDAASWGELLPNRIGIVLSIILVLLNLKDIIRLFPTLVYALDRVRGSIGLEYNVSKARMRNDIALVLALPFCLLIDRYALYRPQFWAWIPPMWSGLATIGLVLAFIAAAALPSCGAHSEARSGQFFRPRPFSLQLLHRALLHHTPAGRHFVGILFERQRDTPGHPHWHRPCIPALHDRRSEDFFERRAFRFANNFVSLRP